MPRAEKQRVSSPPSLNLCSKEFGLEGIRWKWHVNAVSATAAQSRGIGRPLRMRMREGSDVSHWWFIQ
eukprot:1158986-Pelagomonas_calceolata.AAC.4